MPNTHDQGSYEDDARDRATAAWNDIADVIRMHGLGLATGIEIDAANDEARHSDSDPHGDAGCTAGPDRMA